LIERDDERNEKLGRRKLLSRGISEPVGLRATGLLQIGTAGARVAYEMMAPIITKCAAQVDDGPCTFTRAGPPGSEASTASALVTGGGLEAFIAESR